MIDWNGKTVLVTGAHGFLGTYLCEELKKENVKLHLPSSIMLNLKNLEEIGEFLHFFKIDIIFHLAAKCGGIKFNQNNPFEAFIENALMGLNLLKAASHYKVEKVVYIGSVCEYPKNAPIPFEESELWNGRIEETNSSYGLAKKTVGDAIEAHNKQFSTKWLHLILANLYGPEDHFDLEIGHVIPSLIRKMYEAKKEGNREVKIWGDGQSTREFLFVKDAAKAIIHMTKNYSLLPPYSLATHINIGNNHEISISDLAYLIKELIGFDGTLVFDPNMPSGQKRRNLNNSILKKYGFNDFTSMKSGILEAIKYFEEKVVESALHPCTS